MALYQKTRDRGRPPGRAYGATIPVRFTKEGLAAVDAWAEQQNEKGISRSEAIRRLVDQALASEVGSQRKADAAAIQEVRVALERALAALRRLARARR
jgi:hypothetical protein